MSKLFLCVATGHNVANIPSILTLGNSEDHILWIESDYARKNNILNRTFTVLKKKGFSHYTLEVKDEELIQPFQLAEHLKKFLIKNQVQQTYSEIIFVMNGGQKSAVVGIQKAFYDLNIPFSMAYQDIKPQKIFYFPSNGDHFYPIDIKSPMSLDEILTIYGYHLQDSVHTGIFNKDNFLNFKHQLEQDEIFINRYNSFMKQPDVSEYIYRIFNFNVKEDLKRKKIKPVSWKEFKSLFYDDLKKRGETILREIMGTRDIPSPLKSAAGKIANHLSARERQFKMFEGVFNFIIDKLSRNENERIENEIDEYILYKLIDGKWLNPSDKPQRKISELQKIKLGFLFEQFVLFRLLSFLEKHPGCFNNLHEIYTNVKIATLGENVSREFESDILLVFKNGTINSLEIKAFHFTQKDLFSKIAYIRQATGLVTTSYFVLPFFDNWKQDSMFRLDYLKQLSDLREIGLKLIFFTDFDGEFPKGDPDFPIYSFEQTMKNILL